MTTKEKLSIWSIGPDWYVARRSFDIVALMIRHGYGHEEAEEYCSEDPPDRLDNDAVLFVRLETDGDLFKRAKERFPDVVGEAEHEPEGSTYDLKIELKISEWLEIVDEGFLCSTEY